MEDDPRNPALEARRTEHPEDPFAALALGAWLEKQRDPRGRLVAVQHLLAGSTSIAQRKALRAEESRLFAMHETYLLGREGFLRLFQPEWCLGFVRKATAARPALIPHTASARRLAYLLRHPSGRFLQELELQLRDVSSFQDLLGLVMFHRPPTLRRLFIDVAGDANLVRFCEAFPRLEDLRVRANSAALGKLELAQLNSLELALKSGAQPLWETLRAPVLPRLRRLVVDFSSAGLFPKPPAGAFDAFLERQTAPGLRHLALRGLNLDAAFYRRLAHSKALAGLRTLDLSGSSLSVASAGALLEHRAAFKHLSQLDLWGTDLPQRTLSKLHVLASCVRVSYVEL